MYDKWDNFDVDEELDRVDEVEKAANAMSAAAKSANAMEARQKRDLQASAEALEAQAAVARLKMSRGMGPQVSHLSSDQQRDAKEAMAAQAKALEEAARLSKEISGAVHAATENRDRGARCLADGDMRGAEDSFVEALSRGDALMSAYPSLAEALKAAPTVASVLMFTGLCDSPCPHIS